MTSHPRARYVVRVEEQARNSCVSFEKTHGCNFHVRRDPLLQCVGSREGVRDPKG